ncbi:MAG: hypothetical protein ABF569_05145 [Acetobacter sp.]|nr:hypothetical protein [Acetobacter lovaniensis]
MGREAAHMLLQSERDRQRDAARLANPDAKREMVQKLESEVAVGGASKVAPKTVQGRMILAQGNERRATAGE